MSKKIEVDTKTFIRFWLVILGFVLALFFIEKALTGLIIVGIAAFLAIAIQPLARRIDKIDKKENRPVLSSIAAFSIVIVVIGLIISVIGPVVVNETSKFIQQLPDTFQNTIGGWDGINSFGESIGIKDLHGEIYNALQNFSNMIFGNLGGTIVSGIGTAASIITATILVLVLTLFFLLEGRGLMAGFWKLVGSESRDAHKKKKTLAIRHVVTRMKDVIATYVSKQLIVAVLDGCVTALAVFIMSLIFGFSSDLAIPMGLIMIIFYLIPMFGPIISCILVSLIIFFSDPLAGVVFAIFYIVYQQIENNFIAPKIQGNALQLPPVIVLIAITIGMYVFGLLGAIIAIPIAGCIKVLIEEYPKLKELQES